MKPHKPTIINEGLYAEHDQCCPVLNSEFAVIDCATGIFHPSWKAQSAGWRLVRARTWFQRLALRIAFKASEGQS